MSDRLGRFEAIIRERRRQGLTAPLLDPPAGPGTIPCTLVQYWSQERMGDDVRRVGDTWTALNPELPRTRFDFGSALRYLDEQLGKEVASAFELCRHPAMQADLFRLGYLYRQGGLYVDADEECIRPIAPLLSRLGQKRFVAVVPSDGRSHVHSFFIGAEPGFEPLREAVDEVAASLHRLGARDDYWRVNVSETTGVGPLTRALARWMERSEAQAGKILLIDYGEFRTFSREARLDYKNRSGGNWRAR